MKSVKIYLVIFAAILAAGIIGSFIVTQKSKSNIVEIVRDGEILYRLDLSKYSNAETLTINYGDGENIILIENGEICVSHADCPDKTCVKTGKLNSAALPIVCLPHHLVIRYVENNDTLDGVTN